MSAKANTAAALGAPRGAPCPLNFDDPNVLAHKQQDGWIWVACAVDGGAAGRARHGTDGEGSND